jgi:polyhydroxybutyrate depolymerase
MIGFLVTIALAQTPEVVPIKLDVAGLERTGILVKPVSGDQAAPLVFCFHGHGGGAAQARRGFGIESHWPEAAYVYLQGVPTPGQLTDPEGKKTGWQGRPGLYEDRDFQFFSAALDWVKSEVKVDEKRIYTMGHSNGAGFSYLLAGKFPGLFAAIGISAGGFGREVPAPTPVIHIAGTEDPLVKYRNQQLAIERLKRANGCSGEAQPWGDLRGAERWESEKGAPIVFVTHSGNHSFEKWFSEAMIRFFKEHSKN